MQIKQLDNFKGKTRQITLADGEEVVYDINMLEQCLATAPDPIIMDLMDTLMVSMWNTRNIESNCDSNVLLAIQTALKSNKITEYKSDFCKLSCNESTTVTVTYKNGSEFFFSLLDKRLLFTADLVNYVNFSSDLAFKTDDSYFLYEVTADSVKILAYKTVTKNNVQYFRGFDDTVISDELCVYTILQSYLASSCTDCSMDSLCTLLRRRLEWQNVVKDTLGKRCEVKGGNVVQLEPCTIIVKQKGLEIKGLGTGKVFDVVPNIVFTDNLVTFTRHNDTTCPIKLDSGRYYLYKVNEDTYYFIAKHIKTEFFMATGKHIKISGFDSEVDMYDCLNLTDDKLLNSGLLHNSSTVLDAFNDVIK